MREFPFVVEIMVPEGGFGRRLDEMHAFHRLRGITDHRIPRRRDDEHDSFVGVSKTLPLLRCSRRSFPPL
jgi:hypothetical protein